LGRLVVALLAAGLLAAGVAVGALVGGAGLNGVTTAVTSVGGGTVTLVTTGPGTTGSLTVTFPGTTVTDIYTFAELPGPPTLTHADSGPGRVDLAWAAPASDGDAAISGYVVYRGTTAGGETRLTSVNNDHS
jgi:hypothetical protein